MHIEFFPQDAPEGRAHLKLGFSPKEVATELQAAPEEDGPGGHAPENGPEDQALLRAAESLINRGIDAAVKNHGFRPVGRIDIHMDACSRADGVSALLEAEVLPPVEVPKAFEGLTIRIEEAIPPKSDIHAMLERLRRSKGKLEPVSERRLPQAGDVLALDVDGYRNGELAPELHVENYLLNDANAARTPEIAAVARTLHVGESGSCTLADRRF